MLVDLNYSSNTFHLMSEGKQKHYDFIVEGFILGNVKVVDNGESVYIDFLEVKSEHRVNGWGTKIVKELFNVYPKATTLWGMATEDILNGFWTKQKGYNYAGEATDSFEGYSYFDILKR